MISLNQIFLIFSVFGVMLMAVHVLPPLLMTWYEKNQTAKSRPKDRQRQSVLSSIHHAKLPQLLMGALVIGALAWFAFDTIAPMAFLLVAAAVGPKLYGAFQIERRTR